MLVELETARAHIAAAGPGIDRILEGADRRAVLMEGDVAAHEVAAVGQSVGESRGGREQHQPSGLNGAAGKDEDISLLLHQNARGVFVDGARDASLRVDRELMNV